jgi:hypothetical protein
MGQTKKPSGGMSERGRFWQRHLRAWRKTSLSQADYCRQQNLSVAAFGWWKRQLAGSAGSGRKKVQATMPSYKQKCRGGAAGFLEVALPKNPGPLELALSSGRTLRFDAGIGRESLTTILSVLRELELC